MGTSELKYFTPNISDLFVGYECEILSSWGWQKGKWPEVLGEDTLTGFDVQDRGIIEATKSSDLRTFYLTKEQIEAEGWQWDDALEVLYQDDEGHTLCVSLQPGNRVHIYYDEPDEIDTRFWGYCPSINEFRKITKLLNI